MRQFRPSVFEEKLRQENARLRIILRAVKPYLPRELVAKIEAELQDTPADRRATADNGQ